MNKKFIFLAILLILIIGILSYILFKPSPNYSQSTQTCKTISFVDASAPSIVFFSPDEEKVKEFSDYLLQSPPYSKSDFNIYQIPEEPDCDLYQGIALLCYSRDLIKKAAACPNDYIVVLKNMKSNIRSSSYMNVLSLNQNLPKNVIVHEFGHAFGNLADEYVPAKIPRGSKNCVNSCEDFNYETDGCFNDCSDNSHKRSIQNGVMRTLSSRAYGKFDSSLISSRLFKNSVKLSGNAISQPDCTAHPDKFFLVELEKQPDGSVKEIGRELVTGCIGGRDKNGFGSSSLKILDGNKILSSENFNGENLFVDGITSDRKLTGGVYSNFNKIILKVPFNEKADSMQVNCGKSTTFDISKMGVRPCEI